MCSWGLLMSYLPPLFPCSLSRPDTCAARVIRAPGRHKGSLHSNLNCCISNTNWNPATGSLSLFFKYCQVGGNIRNWNYTLTHAAWLNPLSNTDVLSSILLKYSICCPPVWRAEPGRTDKEASSSSLFLSLLCFYIQLIALENSAVFLHSVGFVFSYYSLLGTDIFGLSFMFMHICSLIFPKQSDYKLSQGQYRIVYVNIHTQVCLSILMRTLEWH